MRAYEPSSGRSGKHVESGGDHASRYVTAYATFVGCIVEDSGSIGAQVFDQLLAVRDHSTHDVHA